MAYTNAHAEQDGDEPRSPQDSADQGLKPWAIFAAVVLLLILGGWMNVALSRRMVKFLQILLKRLLKSQKQKNRQL